MKTKAKKWYKRVFYHFTDLAVVNAYILDKVEKPASRLYEYKLEVAIALMYGDRLPDAQQINRLLVQQADMQRAENGDPVGREVSDAVRLDGLDHLPENVAEQGRRCKIRSCPYRSTIWCTKCKVYLCLKKGKNCYSVFHTQRYI